MTWREYRCAEVTRMCQSLIDSGYFKKRLAKYLAIPQKKRPLHVTEQSDK